MNANEMGNEAARGEIPVASPELSPLGWRLLNSRDFGLLFSGQVISQIGDSLNKVALLYKSPSTTPDVV